MGARIDRVEARGKHLLLHLNDGRALHTHLRMTGAWHLYRPGATWKKPSHLAKLVLETSEAVAVCFSAPIVRVLSPRELRTCPWLGALGPDLAVEGFDANAVRENLRALDAQPIGEALLVQSALAGIGNVYKSEVLFRLGADPFAPVALYDDDALYALIEEGARLIQQNVRVSATRDGAFRHGPRTTRIASDGCRLWVYGRAGLGCYVCGSGITMAHQGTLRRSTYWCGSCQTPRTSRDAPLRRAVTTPPDARAPRAHAGAFDPASIRRRERRG